MDNSEDEAELRKIMMYRSEKVFLLCDVSKFNKNAFYKICDLNQIDCIITDAEPDCDMLRAFKTNGIKVIYK